jgi:hypothetical protein
MSILIHGTALDFLHNVGGPTEEGFEKSQLTWPED